MIGNCSPVVKFDSAQETGVIPALELGHAMMDNEGGGKAGAVIINVTPPLSSFHYHITSVSTISFRDLFMTLKFVSLSLGGYHTTNIPFTRNLGLSSTPSPG